MKKKGVKKFFEKQGYKKNHLKISVLIILIAFILFLGWLLFFQDFECNDVDCFKKALENCNKASFIREDEQGLWYYEILKEDLDKCNTKVVLLKIKRGDIDVEEFQGKEMICSIEKNSIDFPEKDLSKCSGELKENLQNLIIERMYIYLRNNVGKINEEFQEL